MSVNTPRGTSPSPNIDRNSKNSWTGGTQPGTTDPKKVIAEQFNKKPVPTNGGKEK